MLKKYEIKPKEIENPKTNSVFQQLIEKLKSSVQEEKKNKGVTTCTCEESSFQDNNLNQSNANENSIKIFFIFQDKYSQKIKSEYQINDKIFYSSNEI